MLKRIGARMPARWPRYSVGRIALALGACGLAFILGTAAFIVGHERQIASREARAAAQGAAFSLADHASRLFEVTDLSLDLEPGYGARFFSAGPGRVRECLVTLVQAGTRRGELEN